MMLKNRNSPLGIGLESVFRTKYPKPMEETGQPRPNLSQSAIAKLNLELVNIDMQM